MTRETPVRILTADSDPPYARPPLSKEFLRGETDDVALHPAGVVCRAPHRARVHTRVAQHSTLPPVRQSPTDSDHPYSALISGERVGAHSDLRFPAASAPICCAPWPMRRRLRDSERRLAVRGGDRRRFHRLRGGGFPCHAGHSGHPGRARRQFRRRSDSGQKQVNGCAGSSLPPVPGTSAGSLSMPSTTVPFGWTTASQFTVTSCSPRPVCARRVPSPKRPAWKSTTRALSSAADMRTSAPDVLRRRRRRFGVQHHRRTPHRRRALAGRRRPGRDRRGRRPRALTSVGMAYLGSGRRSATRRSSITRGATATTTARLIDHDDGFTAWYERDGATVGVLTLNADDDYERGEALIKHAQPVCPTG